MNDLVLAEDVAPHVRLLTLNRAERLNAINAELCGALHAALEAAGAERSCRVIVVTGAGRGFCAGIDLQGYGQAPGNDGTDEARDHLGNQEHMSRLILRLRATPQPVIAAVTNSSAPVPTSATGFTLTECKIAPWHPAESRRSWGTSRCASPIWSNRSRSTATSSA